MNSYHIFLKQLWNSTSFCHDLKYVKHSLIYYSIVLVHEYVNSVISCIFRLFEHRYNSVLDVARLQRYGVVK